MSKFWTCVNQLSPVKGEKKLQSGSWKCIIQQTLISKQRTTKN